MLFEECLKTLAMKHVKTRFVKLDYEEAEIQAEGVPGVIAYRDGDKFAALIPLIDELPDDSDLDTTTVERLLQKCVPAEALCPWLIFSQAPDLDVSFIDSATCRLSSTIYHQYHQDQA